MWAWLRATLRAAGIILVAVVAVAICALAAAFPGNSLTDLRDGSALQTDALVSLAWAALLVWLARRAWSERDADEARVAVVSGCIAGGVLAIALGMQANTLARSPIGFPGGTASGSASYFGTALTAGVVALVVLAIAPLTDSFDRKERTIVAALGLAAGFATAIVLFGGYILVSANALRAAAVARPHYHIPAVGVLATLAGLAILAFVRRRS